MAEVGTYYITIMPSMSSFTSSVKSALSSAGTEGGKTYSTSFLDVVKGSALGSALGGLAQKAGGMIVSGLSTGIARLDTLSNYPKVMQNLGYSAEEAGRSIQTISDHLVGLPSSTDEVVRLTQSIADSTNDLGLATRAALGFSDMMTAAGASTDEVATATSVFNRILGKQNATSAQWGSLMQVMPAELNRVGEYMLGAGKNGQDLYNALNDGTVSWQDFLKAIGDLDESGYINEAGEQMASTEQRARDMSAGIGTAIRNITNRIGRGWASILEVLGQENISNAINKMSDGIANGMTKVAAGLQYVKDAISKTKIAENLGKIFKGIGNAISKIDTTGLKKFADAAVGLIDGALQWIVDHGDIVAAAISGIVGAIEAFYALKVVGTLTEIPALLSGIWAVLSANPIVLVVAGVAALVAGLRYFFTETETGKAIWKGFCDTLKTLWEGLKQDFATLCDTIAQNMETAKAQWEVFKANVGAVIDGIKQFFANLRDDFVSTFEQIKQNLEDNAVQWETFCNNVKEFVNGLWEGLVSIWDGLVSDFNNMVNTIKQNLEDNKVQWRTFCENVKNFVENLKQAIIDKWTEIKNKLTTLVSNIKADISDKWNQIKTTVTNIADNIKSALTDKWNAAKSSIGSITDSIKSSTIEKWNNIKSSVTSSVESIRSSVSDKFNAAKSTALSVFDSIKSGIHDKMQSAYNTVSNIISNIRGLFNFSWSLPRPALPHINWYWQDIGGLLSIPVFSGVSWYGKGGIFDTATLIGIGEKGKEAALPLNDKTYGEIAKGITDELGTAGVTVTGNTFVVREEADIERIADALNRKIRRERMAVMV